MNAVVETGRLSLRQMVPDDAPFILGLLNDPDFHRYIGDRGVRTVEDATAYIRNGPMAMYAQHGFGLYLVSLRESGRPVGICGVLKRDALDHADIGFAFMPDGRGQGLATEAAEGVVAYARTTLGLDRLLAIVQPDNTRSRRLLTRMGFVETGTVRLTPGGPELLLLDARFASS